MHNLNRGSCRIQVIMQWICAEPTLIVGLTSYILRQLRPVSEKDNNVPYSAATFLQPSFTQPIRAPEVLPSEIIANITSFLPTPAALRLRRCSKTLASRTLVEQTSWRDHLIHGDLIDYLWNLDAEDCHKKDQEGSWDWKTLAQAPTTKDSSKRTQIKPSCDREQRDHNDL